MEMYDSSRSFCLSVNVSSQVALERRLTDMSKVKTPFTSDPDFCPECGSILPLPGQSSAIVACMCCSYTVDVAGK